ncbi:MAG TPA: PAS domain S-box protein [Myxococcota bacterium]|jgi:PAS domain S-box-containing protein|nr:PAS domain S-box protein [Myxococcota bacterium]
MSGTGTFDLRGARPPRILVVDDDTDAREFLETLLHRQGWEAVGTAAAAAAFEVAVAQPIDAILLDLMLPDEDGFSLCRRLRAEARTRIIPVLVVSALSSEDDAIAAFDAGADDFVAKPFRAYELMARIRGALRARAFEERIVAAESDMRTILALTQRMAHSLDTGEILFQVARVARDLLAADRAAVVLLDQKGGGRVVAAAEDASITDLPLDLRKYPEIAQVVESGEPLVVEETADDPLLEAVRVDVARAGVRSQVLFPIHGEGRVSGVLFLRTHGRRAVVGEREMGLGRQLASSLAVALRNALLFEEVRADATRLDEARHAAEGRVAELMRFEGFFEGASDGLLILDDEDRVLYVNREGERSLRLARGEAVGHPLVGLFAPESRADAERVCRSARDGERRVHSDFQVPPRRPGEQPRVVQVAASLVGDGGREVMLAFRDVTEERHTAHELRSTKEFLENLIASSADAVVAADRRGTVVLFNRAAEAIYGFAADEVVGRLNVSDLYPPGGARQIMRMLRGPEHGGVGFLKQMRFDAKSSTGALVPITISAAVLRDEHGREVGTVGIFSDLRDRLRMERQLESAQEELRRTEQKGLLAELAGAAAHELNQPLTSILGASEMMKRRTPEGDEWERQRRALGTIMAEAERMAEIVRKIGKITHYETKPYVGGARILDLDASITAAPDPSAAAAEPTPPAATATATGAPTATAAATDPRGRT